MSKLKWNWVYYPYLDAPSKQAESALKAGYIKVVNKDEADKVIADITEGAISMFRESNRCRGLDTISPLGKIASAAFKHWNDVEYTRSNNRQLRLDKANLLRSNELLRNELKIQRAARQNDKIEYNLNIRRHKHKRCLKMAELCKAKRDEIIARTPTLILNHPTEYLTRWENRWLELAEKFKEVK